MFRKSNEELINLTAISDFIEKPTQNCIEEELKNGVSNVLLVLSKNPVAIMNIISNHPFIPTVFLLDDLVEKMNKQNCVEELGILFDKCLDDLVEACTYNVPDLNRLIKAMPKYLDKIIQNILSTEHRFTRILESDQSPEKTLKEMVEKYPQFQKQFSDLFNLRFNSTPILKV